MFCKECSKMACVSPEGICLECGRKFEADIFKTAEFLRKWKEGIKANLESRYGISEGCA